MLDRPMQGYLGPPILVGQPRKPVFNNLTPLFVHGKLSIKKTLVTFVLFFINSGFGTNPWFDLLYFMDNSDMYEVFGLSSR